MWQGSWFQRTGIDMLKLLSPYVLRSVLGTLRSWDDAERKSWNHSQGEDKADMMVQCLCRTLNAVSSSLNVICCQIGSSEDVEAVPVTSMAAAFCIRCSFAMVLSSYKTVVEVKL